MQYAIIPSQSQKGKIDMSLTSIVKDVRQLLIEQTAALEKLRNERDKAKSYIDSGNYRPEYVKDTLMPEYEEKQRAYNRARDGVLQAVNEYLTKYVGEAAKGDTLNPDDLNDDLKLLNSGISLTAKDLQDMWNRNQDNRTMQQLIDRYTREHEISGTGIQYTTARQDAEKDAQQVRYNARLYVEHWIDAPDAMKMLDTMMGMNGQ